MILLINSNLLRALDHNSIRASSFHPLAICQSLSTRWPLTWKSFFPTMTPGVVSAISGGSDVLNHTSETEAPAPKASTRISTNLEEYQYLDLIRDIIDNGEHRPDRTGTGTYSIFAPKPMVYSLSRPSRDPLDRQSYDLVLPLLTTKRVFLKAVIEELLWFISGTTTSAPLTAAGVKIWDGNGSREYLDSVGLTHRAVGDLGPVYGFQWRHFGAKYVDASADYAGQGVDQLAEVIRKLKETPWDRRIILSAWNPKDLGEMALPPCHMFAQFYVSFPRKARGKSAMSSTATDQTDKGVLHTQLYQRSCDMGLGVPFNIASYALLTQMLAHVCDLIPGTLTHVMGDAHVYLDHVEALEEQLLREPREFPTLEMHPEGEERRRGSANIQGIEGWKLQDFEVKGYKPHGKVAMKMSV